MSDVVGSAVDDCINVHHVDFICFWLMMHSRLHWNNILGVGLLFFWCVFFWGVVVCVCLLCVCIVCVCVCAQCRMLIFQPQEQRLVESLLHLIHSAEELEGLWVLML